MKEAADLRPELRRQAREALHGLAAGERERLLIKCWMSHDARWFSAVAREIGLEAANRINKLAVHQLGKVEARRVVALLSLEPAADLDAYLRFQEMGISLLGPDLLDYQIFKVDDHTFRMPVSRCFAYENVCRAGVEATYECGILPRLTGWLEALEIDYLLDPPLAKCLKAQGRECVYTVALFGAASRPA